MTLPAACHAIVIGDPNDPHLAMVLEHIDPGGVVVVDGLSVSSTLIARTDQAWILRDLTGTPVHISPSHPCRGWIRRYGPPGWDHGVQIGSHRAAVLTAKLTLLGALMRDPRIDWLSACDNLASSENKLLQYDAARRLGISVPPTVITASAEIIASEIGEPFILKPLGVSHFRSEDRTSIVFAESRTVADLANVDLLEAPFVMQRRLEALSHLRVVTVRNQAWVCEQAADGLPTDWRRADHAHHGFTLSTAWKEVGTAAISLADSLNIKYSSQDWIVTEDGPSFIDLNPAGQWAFLPSSVTQEINSAIAEWLNESTSR